MACEYRAAVDDAQRRLRHIHRHSDVRGRWRIVIDRMSGRISLLLVGAALILVVLLGWFVLVSPQQAKASKLDSEVNQTNVQLQAVTSLLQGPVGRESLASLRISEI